MKFILIAGLPASGKTMYAQSLEGYLIDDPLSLEEVESEIKKAQEIFNQDTIIITDPHFISSNTRKCCEELLKELYLNCEIKWIFFENDPEQCFMNAFIRQENGDDREVCGFIKEGTKKYTIPENAIVLPAWRN
jgi:RNase adaptor protein for sRNA GlmZ degradation